MVRIGTTGLLLLAGLTWAAPAQAHCEIPCGIYGDRLRFELMAEHITTIEKSMKMIRKLSAAKSGDDNQLIRWVVNKEEHATKLQQIVGQYFMHQRIKPVDKKDRPARRTYIRQLTLAHRLLVAAMKAKQTTDQAQIDELRSLLDDFRTAYFGKKHKKHH